MPIPNLAEYDCVVAEEHGRKLIPIMPLSMLRSTLKTARHPTSSHFLRTRSEHGLKLEASLRSVVMCVAAGTRANAALNYCINEVCRCTAWHMTRIIHGCQCCFRSS